MKKSFALVLFLIVIGCYLHAQSIASKKLENLGLISELVYLKLTAENFATAVLNDTTISDSVKSDFIGIYNEFRMLDDQLILQLISHTNRKNNIRIFRLLDRALFNERLAEISVSDHKNKYCRAYLRSLKVVSEAHSELLKFDTSDEQVIANTDGLNLMSFMPSTASLEELTGVLNFVSGTIKEIRAGREKKVDRITELLDALRASSVQDLLKPKKEEKKEEDK